MEKQETVHCQAYIVWQRFKRNKLAMVGLVILLAMILAAVTADLYLDYEKDVIGQSIADRLLPPGEGHIFGTDQFGRDVFARLIYGGRVSLSVGFLTVAISLAAGSLIGAVAGYFGGRTDMVIMRVIDVFMALPSILLAITIIAALGPSLINLLLAMGISQIPRFSRVVRSSVLSLKNQDYVTAARSCGCSHGWIIFHHILPNAMGPIIVQATNNMAVTILGISSMSFIGLGIQPPMPEWGSMLADAKEKMRYYPHLITVPGLAIILLVLALTFIGDGLRDALDPKLSD